MSWDLSSSAHKKSDDSVLSFKWHGGFCLWWLVEEIFDQTDRMQCVQIEVKAIGLATWKQTAEVSAVKMHWSTLNVWCSLMIGLVLYTPLLCFLIYLIPLSKHDLFTESENYWAKCIHLPIVNDATPGVEIWGFIYYSTYTKEITIIPRAPQTAFICHSSAITCLSDLSVLCTRFQRYAKRIDDRFNGYTESFIGFSRGYSFMTKKRRN